MDTRVKVGRPLRKFIIREWDAGNAVCMLGGFGIGKTETVYQLAKELGDMNKKEYKVFDIKLAGWLPDEVKGIMYYDKEKKVTTFLKPEFIVDEPNIIFFDEITNVPERTITTILEAIAQRKIGQYKFHPETYIIAAGNPPHESSLAHRLVSALKTRFTVIEVIPSADEFSYHATNKGILPEIIAFVNSYQDELYQHRPDEKNMPCPRNYFKLDAILKILMRDGIDWITEFINGEPNVSAHIVSKIGETAAGKFKIFLKTSKFIDIQKILRGDINEASKLDKISNKAERLAIENFIMHSFIAAINKYEDFRNFMKIAKVFSKNVVAAGIILMLDVGVLERLGLVTKIGNHYAIMSKDRKKDQEVRDFMEESGIIDLIMDARRIKL